MPAIKTITTFVHKYFLLLLWAAYVLAALLPAPGLSLRDASFGQLQLAGANLKISPSLLMLAFLIFNTALGIKRDELKHLAAKPMLLISGLIANSLIPIALIFLLRGLATAWHNPDELQNLLTGLALIVAMPIASSSTAWSQNANGNLSLSLGLVLLSTILSPITTPIILHLFSFITAGDYSEDLQELAQQGTNAFMCLTVVVPSLIGILLHFCLGEERTAGLKPILKLLNFIFLLVLNYSNAATSLPGVVHETDVDFLIFILVPAALLCLIGFGSGWWLSRFFKTDKADKASLMFALGMNNNGTALVLAASTLTDHPAVLLPVIFYTLAQQVIAALVDQKYFQDNDKEVADTEEGE